MLHHERSETNLGQTVFARSLTLPAKHIADKAAGRRAKPIASILSTNVRAVGGELAPLGQGDRHPITSALTLLARPQQETSTNDQLLYSSPGTAAGRSRGPSRHSTRVPLPGTGEGARGEVRSQARRERASANIPRPRLPFTRRPNKPKIFNQLQTASKLRRHGSRDGGRRRAGCRGSFQRSR
jgi:hypothetical protein